MSGLGNNPANRQIVWSSGASECQKKNCRFFLIFFLKKLEKYDLTRPKVSKYSLTSWPEVIVVFHGEYKRTVTHTLKLSHCRAARTTASASHHVTSVRGKSVVRSSFELTSIATGALVSSEPAEGFLVPLYSSHLRTCNSNFFSTQLMVPGNVPSLQIQKCTRRLWASSSVDHSSWTCTQPHAPGLVLLSSLTTISDAHFSRFRIPTFVVTVNWPSVE